MTLLKTRNIFAITTLAAMLAIPARAQDVVTVDPALAQKHLTHKVEARYPADALADQVQGTVGLRLSIDTTGHVTDAEVTSGPEALRQAAVDAARQWVYQPFAIGGKPLAAATDVRVSFTLPATTTATAPATPRPAAPAVAAEVPPPVSSAPPPPSESRSSFDGAAGAAEVTDTARPPATTKPAFESASAPAPVTAATAPASAPARPPVASSSFESAAPPAEAAPAAEAATPAETPAPAPPPPSKSAFESAAPADAAPAAQPTAAPASAPAFGAAAPVESSPAVMPPAAESSVPAESPAPVERAVAAPATNENFAPLSEQCHKLMTAHGEVDQLIAVCGEMATAAESFPSDSHYVERRAAYVFDAAALLRAWKYPEAEAMAMRAVGVVEEGHDDVTGASAAYAVLGNAQALNGKLAEADKSLDTAEALERQAVAAAAGHPSQATYQTTLRTILLFHAETLERMGNKSGAAAKRAEAANLLPVAGN